jgi:hypothetical protein
MMVVVGGTPTGEPGFDEELLEYLPEPRELPVEPVPSLRELWATARRQLRELLAEKPSEGSSARWDAATRRGAGLEAPVRLRTRFSARFFRSIGLPSGATDTAFVDWWAARGREGTVTVARRLRLSSPRGDVGGWTMDGRLRRFTRWHCVPVVVEVSSIHGHWVVSMTPRTRVVASGRYFRTGNRALDRLSTELVDHAANH